MTKMNCQKTKELLHDCADGRLAEPVARAVQRHVAECSDCRVFQQRELRLQQLLAVKRHETPGADYFDNFLGEFQRRLAVATAPRPTLWQQVCARLHLPSVLVMRPGYAQALGTALVVVLIWRGLAAVELPAGGERQDFTIPHSTPRAIAAVLPDNPASAAVLPVLTQVAFNAPRYVLDRIAATPVSYEVASIHF